MDCAPRRGSRSAGKFGKQPVDFRLQAFWYAEKPDNGPDWALQFQVKLLFPKEKQK
jgi:hypothetical protein